MNETVDPVDPDDETIEAVEDQDPEPDLDPRPVEVDAYNDDDTGDMPLDPDHFHGDPDDTKGAEV